MLDFFFEFVAVGQAIGVPILLFYRYLDVRSGVPSKKLSLVPQMTSMETWPPWEELIERRKRRI